MEGLFVQFGEFSGRGNYFEVRIVWPHVIFQCQDSYISELVSGGTPHLFICFCFYSRTWLNLRDRISAVLRVRQI